MSETTAIPKIYQAMINIANELKAPKDTESKQWDAKANRWVVKYSYRTLSAVKAALKPLLEKYKVFINISTDFETKEATQVITDYQTKITSVLAVKRQEMKMTAQYISLEDGSKVENHIKVNCDDHSKIGMSAEQASGSAHTYAEKTLLSLAFHIEDDADETDPDALQGKQQNSFTQERVVDTRQATTYTAEDLQKGLAEVNACVSEVDLNSKMQGRKNLWGVDAYKNACTAKRAALKSAAAV